MWGGKGQPLPPFPPWQDGGSLLYCLAIPIMRSAMSPVIAQYTFPLLFFVLILAAPLSAAEFSATMILKEQGMDTTGKIFVKDGKMRQEFLDDRGHTVTVVRKDKSRIWVIMPYEKRYVEMPMGFTLPGQFLQIPPDAMSKRKVGTEEICGYQVDRLEVMLRGGPEGVTRQTFWVSPKLGLPIKTVSPERQYSVEYRDIKETKLEDKLFEVPPGYQKSAGPLDLP